MSLVGVLAAVSLQIFLQGTRAWLGSLLQDGEAKNVSLTGHRECQDNLPPQDLRGPRDLVSGPFKVYMNSPGGIMRRHLILGHPKG